jgi:hypothetical protein
MESPQFSSAAIPTPNGTNMDTAHTATEATFGLSPLITNNTANKATPSTQTPPISPVIIQKLTANPGAKLPNLAPQTKLTGEAALANRQMGQSPSKRNIMVNDSVAKNEAVKSNEISPNPAAVLAAYPTSRPGDAPQEPSQPSQVDLGRIATAAMDNTSDPASGAPAATANSNGSSEIATTAGPSNPADSPLLNESNAQFQAMSPVQPLRAGSISEQASATTPTTERFSATTPTTPFSPSATTPGGSRGKHTCPHCQQSFTRHHNLKSHLLTHSQEKPFVCNSCQSRFRRLHDLKRHSKLHTGERPHVCHKCGRKFARGDALARHTRAEGGCAGRRTSMAGISEDGSMGTGMGGDGEDMEGLEGLMDGDADGDVDMIGSTDSNDPRRRSLPSIRTDFSNGQAVTITIQGGNPITPASGVTNYGHTPNQHHSSFPGLSTPNRTASTAGPSPGVGLFPPHKTNINTPVSATSMASSAVPTPSTAGGPMSNPAGNMMEAPRVLAAQNNVPNVGMQPQNVSATDKNFNGFVASLQQAPAQQQQQQQQQLKQQNPAISAGAPTADMGANQNMFIGMGMENIWQHTKRLEERVNMLEGVISNMADTIQALQAQVAANATQKPGGDSN